MLRLLDVGMTQASLPRGGSYLAVKAVGGRPIVSQLLQHPPHPHRAATEAGGRKRSVPSLLPSPLSTVFPDLFSCYLLGPLQELSSEPLLCPRNFRNLLREPRRDSIQNKKWTLNLDSPAEAVNIIDSDSITS